MGSSRILFAPFHGDFGMAAKLSRIGFTISVAMSFLANHALSQCELEALLPTEVRTMSGAYGWSVALDGSYLAVGAPASTIDYFQVGAVFVFENGESGWTQQAELLDSVPQFNGLFGTSVSIHGDLLIVGSPMSIWAGNHLGRAFVFRRGAEGWAEEALLVPSLQASGDEFGKSVSVDVDRVAVGAPMFNHVFVFRRFDDSYACVTDQDCLGVGSPKCSDKVCDGVVWVE